MQKNFLKFAIPVLLLNAFIAGIFFWFHVSKAQDLNTQNNNAQSQSSNLDSQKQDETKQDFFEAKILEIKNESEETSLDGIKTFIQTYRLRGLDGDFKNKIFEIKGSEFNTLSKNGYEKNDSLLISHSKDESGQDNFAIIDYVREPSLYLLTFLFIGLVILMGKMKGVKALLSLALSFIIIIFFIVPQIIHGANPVLISAIGCIMITLISLYLIYGFKGFTHLATVSIGTSLLLTVVISQWFTDLAKLTGNSEEQVSYLSQMLGSNFNTKGLLLAGFIIGALGVLDDIVINQISLIEELHNIDAKLTWKNLFQKGLKVGIDHISAIVNSLFLAYVGASLPLLLLFSADKSAQLSFSNTINLEIIATEIIRTLTGSVGLILSVPISTFIAALYFSKQKVPETVSSNLPAEERIHHRH